MLAPFFNNMARFAIEALSGKEDTYAAV